MDSLVEIHILTIKIKPKQWLAENQKNELKDAKNSVELRTTAHTVLVSHVIDFLAQK